MSSFDYTSRLFVYVGTIVAKIKAYCTTPISQPPNIVEWYTCALVLLIDLLINFYAVVFVIVMSAC